MSLKEKGFDPSRMIKTCAKTMKEVNCFYDWIDEHCMEVSYLGDYFYYVEGDEDAVLFKLRWG